MQICVSDTTDILIMFEPVMVVYTKNPYKYYIYRRSVHVSSHVLVHVFPIIGCKAN